ncbi:MAG: hypothetical protein ACYTEN_02635 [Planctomycetota bacterium]|jgi:hypothetical protein
MSERFKKLALVLAFYIVLMPFLWGIVASPSKINCTVQEVNIQTGQLRRCRYFYYIKVSEVLQETAIAECVDEPVVFRDTKAWWRINAFGPFRKVSPYYVFHTTVWGDMRDFSLDAKNKTDEEKKETAVRILQKWQNRAYEITQRYQNQNSP